MTGLVAAAGGALALGFSLRYTWWRPRRRGTPILMYHQVGPHRTASPLNRWRVTEADFSRQMHLLTARGLRGAALTSFLARPAEERRAVLTFDDGYDGVRTRALPILSTLGFGATVFVVSGKLGGRNDWDGESPGEELLTAQGLREIHAQGIEIGSHSETHRDLTKLGNGELRREIAASKARLEDVVGAPVTTFCYPYGAFDERVVDAVGSAGYRAATAIRGGISPDLSDPFRLKRVAVRGTNTLLDFRLALTRGRSRL